MTSTPVVPEDRLSLAQSPIPVTLSTVGPTGYPQVSAIWVLYEDGVFRTSLTTGRQKFKNLERHPKATLFFLDPEDPMRFLEVRGDVSSEPDHDLAFVEKIVTHYGVEFEQFRQRVPMENRVIVTLTPTRIRSEMWRTADGTPYPSVATSTALIVCSRFSA